MPKMGIKMPEMGNTAITRGSRPARRKAAASLITAPTSLADALFTTTQQRVLALLFGQPSRSFYASELIELTGSGSGAVQRELKRLASSGLVTVKHIGNQKHYQANPDSPVFEELSRLVKKTVALAEPIRAALMMLASRIELAMLYGSVVKGTDTATSDIDLLIVADGITLEDIYSALAPVEGDLDRKVSPTLYTPREFADRKAANNPFLARVLSGEYLVLIGKDHEPPAAR
jgi:predicted nucleotidyltransferase/predicted transcriptional regulator